MLYLKEYYHHVVRGKETSDLGTLSISDTITLETMIEMLLHSNQRFLRMTIDFLYWDVEIVTKNPNLDDKPLARQKIRHELQVVIHDARVLERKLKSYGFKPIKSVHSINFTNLD